VLAPKLDASRIQPTKDRILAFQYVRPAMHGRLHLPESYEKDGTWNWWEAVACGPDVERKLGMRLQPGDLFRTPWRPAIDLGIEDEATGRRLFMVSCTVQQADRGKLVEKLNVEAVYPKTW
jgi:hypothetical protein